MIGMPDPTEVLRAEPTYSCCKLYKKVFRFRITLQDVVPVVWRQIEVPDCYTFWDLHIAITDAFGWLDYHLHEFNIPDPKTGKPLRLGSPDEEGFAELDEGPKVKPDWTRKLSSLFTAKNSKAIHSYDFGDGWEHLVVLETILPREKGVAYPRCLCGEGVCPPDDCGGPGGYLELLKAIGNPRHKEHKQMVNWLQGMKGAGFDPKKPFDPSSVQFDDPAKRWKIAFDGEELTPDMRCWDFFKKQGEGPE